MLALFHCRKNGKDREGAFPPGSLEAAAHTFQEYTYKKITPCDVCSQVLRGHTRQGLKCRVCKLNVHVDCQEKVGRCQPKSRLLRRQKSTSEIETRIQEPLPDEEIQQPFKPLWSRLLLYELEPSRASFALCFKTLLMTLLPASVFGFWCLSSSDAYPLTCPARKALPVATLPLV
ncbi:hypothetical protein B7P43_G00822 [Cryptotermes secundus]|uniref:Phorbol-ester/DAG-type domain-containing protein n=1 Tax=Cryptotermes secundus TaxID=105785 RepID=A0A2J7PDQ9_9NEOP|nr:hypothetical protein B7P43_G00822 [Cryptotermes secundus]